MVARIPVVVLTLLSLATVLAGATALELPVEASDKPQPRLAVEKLLADYVSKRLAQIEQLQTQRLATSNANGSHMGNENGWRAAESWSADQLPLTSQQGRGVQLSGTAATRHSSRSVLETLIAPQTISTIDAMAAGGKLPRFPARTILPPQLVELCPSQMTVKRFGATGNGQSDDAGSIRRALSDNSVKRLYVPPGTYRIASNLEITKPMTVGKGAMFEISPGVVLTLSSQPQHWDQDGGMFTGAGRVVFRGGVKIIDPDWFKAAGVPQSDSDLLQKASDSCLGTCTVLLTRAYWTTRVWTLNPRVGVFATRSGLLKNVGDGRGVTLAPGKYTQVLRFGSMQGYDNFAIQVQGGVTGAEIQADSITDGGIGLLFSPQTHASGTIANVFFTHFTWSVAVQNMVAIEGSKASQSVQNCLVAGNFVLAPGSRRKSQQSAGVLLRGAAAPRLVNTAVLYQAVDAYQFPGGLGQGSQFAMLQNAARTAASGLIYRVEGWAGGWDGAGKLFLGAFNNLRASFHKGSPLHNPAMFGAVRGNNNAVGLGELSSPGFELTAKPQRVANDWVAQEQAFYFQVSVDGVWRAGKTRTVYLQSIYATTAGAGLRMKCLPRPAPMFARVNTGVTCVGVQYLPGGSGWDVAVKLRNSSKRDLTSADQVRLGLQVGP
ncbi:hypothetical protein N2152v2_001115 [Parachlorella kessleri]